MISLTTDTKIAGLTMQSLMQSIRDCEEASRRAYGIMCRGGDKDIWGQYAQTVEERAEDAREKIAALVEAMFPGVSAEELGRVLL